MTKRPSVYKLFLLSAFTDEDGRTRLFKAVRAGEMIKERYGSVSLVMVEGYLEGESHLHYILLGAQKDDGAVRAVLPEVPEEIVRNPSFEAGRLATELQTAVKELAKEAKNAWKVRKHADELRSDLVYAYSQYIGFLVAALTGGKEVLEEFKRSPRTGHLFCLEIPLTWDKDVVNLNGATLTDLGPFVE